MRTTPKYLSPSVTECWLRRYQVLPGRTHPTMSTSGTGGFLLQAYKMYVSVAFPRTDIHDISTDMMTPLHLQFSHIERSKNLRQALQIWNCRLRKQPAPRRRFDTPTLSTLLTIWAVLRHGWVVLYAKSSLNLWLLLVCSPGTGP